MKWLWALPFVAISLLISSTSAAVFIEPVYGTSSNVLVDDDGIADASLTASGLLTFSFQVPQVEHETIVTYRQIDASAGDWLPLSATISSKLERQNYVSASHWKPEPVITGGSEVTIENHPYQVRLATIHGSQSSWCGGALLSPQWVLTAAHCVYAKDKFSPPNRLIVGYGKSKRSDINADSYFIKSSSQQIVHPQFSWQTNQNDIALVKLDEPVDMRYAGLLPVHDMGDPTNSSPLFITGWGNTTTIGTNVDHLRGALVNLDSQCGQWGTRINPSIQVCAVGSAGQSACHGDSGGPLVINEKGVLYSFGVASFRGESCESIRTPLVYGKVSAYKEWIETNTGPLWSTTIASDSSAVFLANIEECETYAVRISPITDGILTPTRDWLLKANSSQCSVASADALEGYWLLEETGQVHAFGDAEVFSDVVLGEERKAVDIEASKSGFGYWILDDGGTFHKFGDAASIPSADLSSLKTKYDFGISPAGPEKVVSSIPTSSGQGAYVFTSIGRVIRTGDAVALTDSVGREDLLWIEQLNAPIVDARITADRSGYWLLAEDGGIFTFGNAGFAGAVPEKPRADWIDEKIVSFAPDNDGEGYVIVAASGKAWFFEHPIRPQLQDVIESAFGTRTLNQPIALVKERRCGGYLMVATDGGVFATPMSDCGFQGSLGDDPPDSPILALASLD
jgi:hypothetical protein